MIKYNRKVIEGIVFIASMTFTTLFLTDLYNERNKALSRPKRDKISLEAKKTLQQEAEV